MAKIVGGVATTHVPSIGKAIADKKENDPYWQPFFRGFDYVHDWLARQKPDIAVVFYNDHGLNFFLDKLPTFAVGAAILPCRGTSSMRSLTTSSTSPCARTC
jgi:protocatechuate 4,5-dioxygenase beta chain